MLEDGEVADEEEKPVRQDEGIESTDPVSASPTSPRALANQSSRRRLLPMPIITTSKPLERMMAGTDREHRLCQMLYLEGVRTSAPLPKMPLLLWLTLLHS